MWTTAAKSRNAGVVQNEHDTTAAKQPFAAVVQHKTTKFRPSWTYPRYRPQDNGRKIAKRGSCPDHPTERGQWTSAVPLAGNAVSETAEASRGGVEVDGLLDATAEHGFALLDDDAPAAELLRGAGRVGDEQHGHVLVGDDAVDPLAALLRELAVADGQRLVHHQSDDDASYI